MGSKAHIYYGLDSQNDLVIICYHEPITARVKSKSYSSRLEIDNFVYKVINIDNDPEENIELDSIEREKLEQKKIEKAITEELLNIKEALKDKVISRIILAADVNLCASKKGTVTSFLINDTLSTKVFGDVPIVRILESTLSEVVAAAFNLYEGTTKKIATVFKTKSRGFDEEFLSIVGEPSPDLLRALKINPDQSVYEKNFISENCQIEGVFSKEEALTTLDSDMPCEQVKKEHSIFLKDKLRVAFDMGKETSEKQNLRKLSKKDLAHTSMAVSDATGQISSKSDTTCTVQEINTNWLGLDEQIAQLNIDDEIDSGSEVSRNFQGKEETSEKRNSRKLSKELLTNSSIPVSDSTRHKGSELDAICTVLKIDTNWLDKQIARLNIKDDEIDSGNGVSRSLPSS
ncbi:hypothetical protein ACNVED_09435 [Legionella sp. D16C41]|uniref:hypothetical protein n=1 Tax=Legionella sp. D16C41 TaxID=3402688 RepID=UPI003AF7ACA7